MSSTKVSIIVPVYNVEKYIAQCLDSIIAQTLDDIQIICVDDCSTDNSVDVVKKYIEKDSRIVLLRHDTNKGLSCARNTGIAYATGEYVGFVDSDDYVDETMFEKMYTKAEKTGSDIVISNINLYFEDTGKTSVFRNNLFYTFLSGRTFSAIEYPLIIMNIGAWDKIYRRTYLLENNLTFPEGKIYEDHIFTVKAYVTAKKMSVVNEPLYYYRKNSGVSITDKEIKNDKYKFDYMEMSRLSKEFMKEKGVYDFFRKHYNAYQFHQATFHQSNATCFESFERIFNEMRQITDEKDYQCLKKLGMSPESREYLGFLEKNDLKAAYKSMRKKR